MSKTSNDEKEAAMSFRMDRQLKADLEAIAAADDDRPLASYVRKVLRQHVEDLKRKKASEPKRRGL